MRIRMALALSLAVLACAPQVPSENTTEAALQAGTPEADAVIALVNDPDITLEILDDDVGLDARAANGLINGRPFETIAQIDAVSYVGRSALSKLVAYARANGYVQGGDTGPTEAQRNAATLAVVNDPAVSQEILDDDVGLDARAARNIIATRNGADGVAGTADDVTFDTVAQLDAVSYVGRTALDRILEYALANGYLNTGGSNKAFDVIFSPNIYSQSHNVRVASIIDSAQSSLDIAMYSFSDARISSALSRAVQRGVKVRFIFETAASDRKKDPSDRWNTKSGRLEAMGINVRWVNKIMHHKFVLVDGPRDDLAAADTATLVTGSGNWSNGAATRYDENTLFLTGYPELVLEIQRQFNLLWQHSKDFEHVSLPYELSSVTITDSDITDDASTDVFFTSDNFSVSGTTFRIRSGIDTVADQLVAAIQGATDSIWVASGHLRSRPVAEALMAKAAANPSMDIRVLLDSQEFISAWSHNQQLEDREDCLEAAGTSASKIRKCNDKGFKFGYQVDQSGIDVRYKYYAYRWHYSYALQMHHKLMIIDGDELWTGSYNLSDNAEHNTFENMFVFRGPEHAGLVSQYENNFLEIWTLEADSTTYQDLLDEIENASNIPLVFTPMTLDFDAIEVLRSAVRANCADLFTTPYRTEPENHRFCPRT